MKTEKITIEGMSCNHCKEAVEGALNKVTGVKKAEVNLRDNSVTVSFDENNVSVATLKDTIEEQGYDVV
ncbi:copper chaperone CopZ [Salipaludibacillus sp. LMS25]|jgi:copper chaperone|uniref:copper chaperone CopZ n=1 Tax=Salipaludibacillus sp. LMS25 TaxID=2924031 RepID=UPI0020D05DAB|nr:copper chaperone CopZ [Salipaludibacillus sp. LMS25]UTR14985.1 copper chaperone CopZ [Salipaludibacillus sp. LMS25]